MSWYSELGGYHRSCLGSINTFDDDELEEMFFIINENMQVKKELCSIGYEDFEQIMESAPVSVRNYLKGCGIKYEKVIQDKNVAIRISFDYPVTHISAKKMHWAINIPRYLSEQCRRYAIFKHMNNKYSMGITPFECFILSHNYSYLDVQDGNVRVKTNYPSDQTMFNGWRTGADLDTVMSRIFDVNEEDETEYVTSNYTYWFTITPNKKMGSISDDLVKFADLICMVEFTIGNGGGDASKPCSSRDLFIKQMTEAASILRKYINKGDENVVLV